MMDKILKRKWKKSEKDAQKKHGLKETPASGATWHTKGDADGKYKLYNRYTENVGMRINFNELSISVNEAMHDGKMAVWRFDTPAGKYIMLSEDDFEEILFEAERVK